MQHLGHLAGPTVDLLPGEAPEGGLDMEPKGSYLEVCIQRGFRMYTAIATLLRGVRRSTQATTSGSYG